MKDYLVDVPVRVMIWIREDCQRKQFDVIKKARPNILFLISDGGRNEKEWEAIYANRRMFDEGIDWNCKVYRLYEDSNTGMYGIGKKVRELIWNTVDRCIFLEDDYVPSVSYFKYCAELLEKYKDDTRISNICGMNHLGEYEDVNADYFFSRKGSIWGIAMWKRTVEQFDDYNFFDDDYVRKTAYERVKKNKIFRDEMEQVYLKHNVSGHPAGSEFYIRLLVYMQNQLQIIPKRNMIANLGCDDQSEHSDRLHRLPKGLRKTYNIKTYELDFPLKHPKYVMPDVNYEKKVNRVLAYGHPFINLYRRIERLLLVAKDGDFKYIKEKLKKYRGIKAGEIEK